MSNRIKPRRINLEASSLCQLRCPSCPRFTSSFQATVGQGFLKFGDFQKLIDNNSYIDSVELSNYGELFLNSNLIDIIKYAYAKNVILDASNGVNLNDVNEDVLEALVKYKFHHLLVSIDGASNNTYKRYRVRGVFEKVIYNIKKINYYKQKHQSIYPFLDWGFVIFGHNEHELTTARQMAADLNMGFVPKLSWDEDFSPIKDQDLVKKESGYPVVSRKEYKQKFGADFMQAICNDLWDNPQINWDGKVLGCCRNFWGDFGGNVFKEGFVIAVNNEKIQYARAMVLGKEFGRDDIPCFFCDIYQTMVKNKNFLKRN